MMREEAITRANAVVQEWCEIENWKYDPTQSSRVLERLIADQILVVANLVGSSCFHAGGDREKMTTVHTQYPAIRFAITTIVDDCTARFEGPSIEEVIALRDAAHRDPSLIDTFHIATEKK